MSETTAQIIERVGLIPVLRAKNPKQAHAVVEAMIAGGVTVVEVTMTVPGAVDLLRELGRSRRVRDFEGGELFGMGRRFDDVDLDILAHLFDCIFAGKESAESRLTTVEMKAIDGGLQAGATQDLLGHALYAILKADGYVRKHVLLGNFLLFHEDQSFRFES